MQPRWRGAKRSSGNPRERRRTPRASNKSERRSPPRSRSWKSALLRSGKRSRTHARENLRRTRRLRKPRASLDTIFTQLREVEVGAAEVAARKAERRAQAGSLRTEAERLEVEERAARERAEALEIAAGGAAHRHAERRHQLELREEELLDARGRAEDAAREAALAQDEATRASSVARDHSVELRAAESRLHTIEELENSLEGHVPGTRAIVEAWQRGDLRGIEGIVSNLITTDERYARALDVAFGARLSNVVTTTSEDAERGVDFLNRTQAGRATFLPLDTLERRQGRELDAQIAGLPGVIGYAHTLVRTAPRFEGIVNFLVGNVLIVTALDTGIVLVRGQGLRDTIVTLSGEQITGGGAITGGRFQRERSILSRRFQAASLREALIGMHERLVETERALQAAHQHAQNAIEARDAGRERQARSESRLVGVRAEESALRGEVERTRAELEAARATATELHARAARARELEREHERDEPEGERSNEERQQLESELARVRDEIGRAEKRRRARSTRTAPNCASELRRWPRNAMRAKARLAMLDQDSERGGLAREEMLAQITSLMEETRTTHAHLEGLRKGIVALDARARSGAQRTRNARCAASAGSNRTFARPSRRSATRPPAGSANACVSRRSRRSSGCWFRSSRRIRRPAQECDRRRGALPQRDPTRSSTSCPACATS